MAGNIGVLALQGAFAKHIEMLTSIGISAMEIRYPQQLSECHGLILPGGESTTMIRQMSAMHWIEPLKAFAKKFPLFGTCAGMILMAQTGILALLDLTVKRNAYGRQAHSFSTPITFLNQTFPAFFIRAPRITTLDPSKVQILIELEAEPILIQQGHHLACSFHPELTTNPAIHQYFGRMCAERLNYYKMISCL